MSKSILLAAILMFLTSGVALACHQGDLFQLRTHKAKQPIGIFVITEVSLAATSTSTVCNSYSDLLDRNYDQVAENAAQGSGAFINVIADAHGCSPEVHAMFGEVVQAHHASLFDASTENDPQVLIQRFHGLIDQDPRLRMSCRNSV